MDFLGYAKPSRLLLAAEPEVCADSSLEKILKWGGCNSVYTKSSYVQVISMDQVLVI
ncbi:unnamed protein product [Camellia sinensis]